MACAFGGIISIDFENPQAPKVETVDFDFESMGYKIILVDTGGSHADLTDDYASIPNEMKSVAKFFNKEFCRDVSMNDILSNCKKLRTELGDRAILRAMHFIEENEKVVHQVSALRNNDFSKYLELVNQSGNSSFNITTHTRTALFVQIVYSNIKIVIYFFINAGGFNHL